MKSLTVVALRNLGRKPIRTAVLFLCAAVVAGGLFAFMAVSIGMTSSLKAGAGRLGADILVVPKEHEPSVSSAIIAGEPAEFYMKRSVLDRIAIMEGVKAATPQIFVKPTPFSCCYNVDVFLIGFDPETDFTVKPWLKGVLSGPLGTEQVIVGSDIPALPGQNIPFYGTDFEIAGVMEPTGMKYFDRSVFMTAESAYRMAEHSKERGKKTIVVGRDEISAVLVDAGKDSSAEMIAIKIEHEIPEVRAVLSDRIIGTVKKRIGGIVRAMAAIGALAWGAGIILFWGAYYSVVNERRREIGLLRAMGAKKSHVAGIILLEAGFVAFSGGIAGAVFSGLVLYLFGPMLRQGTPYLHQSSFVLLGSACAVLAGFSGVLASVLPALSAGRLAPYDAVRSE